MRGTWALRLLIPAILAAVLIIDVTLQETSASQDDLVAAEVVNQVMVPPENTLTSTWFCPLVHLREVLSGSPQPETEDENGDLIPASEPTAVEMSAEISITNISNRPVRALLELNSTRDAESLSIVVGPREVETIDVTQVEIEPGEMMSAVVEVVGGGVAVTRRLTSPLGFDQARCSSTVSAQWEVPIGDTQADARNLIVIHNPLPRHAVVDVSLASDVEPGAFVVPELQGMVIDGRSARVIDVANFARRRTVASATVFARTGRTAVDHIMVYDGSVGRAGFSAELAIPATGEQWWLPLPGIDQNSTAFVRVLNSTEELAEVDITASNVMLDEEGLVVSSFSDTVSVVVLPNDVTEVRLAPSTSTEPDTHTLLVSPGVPVSVTVASTNGVLIAPATEVLLGNTAEPSAPDSADGTGAGSSDEDAGDDFGSDLDDLDPAVVEALRELEEDLAAELEAEVVAQRTVLSNAVSGLSSVPGHRTLSNRWLLVVPPGDGTQAYVTLQTEVPEELAENTAEQINVEVRSLAGQLLDTISVPIGGAVSHQITPGTVRLLVADTPFVPVVFQHAHQGHGLSGIVALSY